MIISTSCFSLITNPDYFVEAARSLGVGAEGVASQEILENISEGLVTAAGAHQFLSSLV